MTVELPDERMRDEFEAALRVWVRSYQRSLTNELLLRSVAATVAEEAGGDVAGFLLSKPAPFDPRKLNYLDWLGGAY